MIRTKNKLPIAILSPHGGLKTPPEINGRIALSEEHIFNEADAYIDEIFDFRDRVLYYETFPYARCLVDLNRPLDGEIRHREGDGIIKVQTSYGDKVFYPGQQPNEQLEAQLIEKYYKPWHKKLDQIAADERVKLVIDCHSMASKGPSAYDNPFNVRPFAMVGNMGDKQGEIRPKLGMVTAAPEQTRRFAEEIDKQLADVVPFAFGEAHTAVNHPYAGGWNIYGHGAGPQPWVMLELSRGLYIGDQSANSPIVPLNKERIALLRDKMWLAIEAFVDYLLAEEREAVQARGRS